MADEVSPLLQAWKEKMARLAEWEDWCARAEPELVGAPRTDSRWGVFDNVVDAANKLRKEIDELEQQQESALAAHLAKTGPLTVEFGDGTRKVLSAGARTAAGTADLLPADLLRVWRVATVFGGSVVGNDGQPQKLTFGDAEQIEWFKTKRKKR